VVRTTLGAEVDTTVTVSGSESVDFLNADRTTNIPSGGAESVTVRPPSGSIYELLGLRLSIDGISGEGATSHFLKVRSEAEIIGVINGSSVGDSDISFRFGYWRTATDNSEPESTTAQTTVIQGLRADDTNGYLVRYDNGTNSAQTATRQYRFWVREIEVSE